MGYENLSIKKVHNPVFSKPSCYTTYLKSAFSCMENLTLKISLPVNFTGFSSTLPFQRRDQILEHSSYQCTQWNNKSSKGVSSKALFWRSWMVTKGYGSQSSHTHLHLHIDCSDWPDGFLQNNMFIWIVSKTLCGNTLIFCKRPADGSLHLPRSSPKYISWTSCYAIFSYICWYLTVNI